MNGDTDRIVNLLDALAVQTGRIEERLGERIDGLTTEVRTGFDRVERRLGHIETRLEGLETEFRAS